jgi:hypothetical protein
MNREAVLEGRSNRKVSINGSHVTFSATTTRLSWGMCKKISGPKVQTANKLLSTKEPYTNPAATVKGAGRKEKEIENSATYMGKLKLSMTWFFCPGISVRPF